MDSHAAAASDDQRRAARALRDQLPTPCQWHLCDRSGHDTHIMDPPHCTEQVKADYSNLEDVVKGLLGDPARMQRIADTAYQRLLAHSQEKTIAQDIAVSIFVKETASPKHLCCPQRHRAQKCTVLADADAC